MRDSASQNLCIKPGLRSKKGTKMNPSLKNPREAMASKYKFIIDSGFCGLSRLLYNNSLERFLDRYIIIPCKTQKRLNLVLSQAANVGLWMFCGWWRMYVSGSHNKWEQGVNNNLPKG